MERKRRVRLFVLLALLSLPLLCLAGCSENTISGNYSYLSTPTPSPGVYYGTLEGYVIASNGKSAPVKAERKGVSVPLGFHVLPGVRVTLGTGEAAVTDAQGKFYFPRVRSGACAVKIFASDAGYYKDFTQNVTIIANSYNYINNDPINPFIVAVSKNVPTLELYSETDISAWPKVVTRLRVVDNTPPMPVDIPCISKDNFTLLMNGTSPYTGFTMVAGADNRYTFTIPNVPLGSRSAKLTLNYAGMTSSTTLDFSEFYGNMVALLVGVNIYQFVTPDLPECKPDVVDTWGSLEGSAAWAVGQMAIMYDNLPTKANIKSAIMSLSGTFTSKDLFLLVFSSHGTNDGTRGYLIPYDGTDDSSTWISGDELKSWLEALRKPGETSNFAVVLDSCFSGMFIGKGPLSAVSKYVPMKNSNPGFSGETPEKQIQEMPDAVAITACAGTETSLAVPALGHSLCINYLIEGLGPGAVIGPADLDHDGQISMAELYNYAQPLVVDYALQVPHEQHPQFYSGPPGRNLIIKY